MKRVLMALAIALVFCPAAQLAAGEARGSVGESSSEPLSALPAGSSGTAPAANDSMHLNPATDPLTDPPAVDRTGRYEGPNVSEVPHPDPPCPPGG